jgi:hypothetical protein
MNRIIQLLGISLFIFLFAIAGMQNVSDYPIMSYEEYAQTKHAEPYIFKLSKLTQHLYYFGANHSCEPNNFNNLIS